MGRISHLDLTFANGGAMSGLAAVVSDLHKFAFREPYRNGRTNPAKKKHTNLRFLEIRFLTVGVFTNGLDPSIGSSRLKPMLHAISSMQCVRDRLI